MTVDPSDRMDAADPSIDPTPPLLAAGPATDAMRLQILSTEHWSLLASRGLAWNESFTRTSMFLSTLSFASVALALVAQATGFGETFRIFALAILPVVLFLGVSTLLRLESANYHDVICVVGMNRIRACYLQLAPDLAPILVMGVTDDMAGIGLTMATQPGRSIALNFLSAAPVLVAVLNGIVVAVIVVLLAAQLGAGVAAALAMGIIGFVGTLVVFAWYTRNLLRRQIGAHRPLFPGPDRA